MIFKRIFLSGIFLAPLIFPFFGFGFENSKVIFLLFYILLVSVLWNFSRISFQWTNVKILSAIFIGVLWLTSFTGIDPKSSILGSPPYFQGVLIYTFLFLFSIIVSTSKIPLSTFSKVISASAFAVSLIAIIQFILLNLFQFNVPTYAGRVTSTFGQPNFYSGFLIISLPFTLSLIRSSGIMYSTSLFLSGLAILISYSRIAISIFLLGLFVLVFKVVPKTAKILLIIFATLIIYPIFLGFFNSELILPHSNLWLINNSPEKRVLIWPVVLDLIEQKPIVGYGPENLRPGFSNYLNSFNINTTPLSPELYSLKQLPIDRSHNLFLDLLIFSGIPGLLTFLILSIYLLYKSRNSKTLQISLMIYLVWMQFQNQSIIQLLYFWLLVGLIDNSPIDS